MSFNNDYEKILGNALRSLALQDSTLWELLKKKREFGVSKYGELSYQLSYENAMKVDTSQHAKEELEDFLNYILHELYKAMQKGELNDIEKAMKLFSEGRSLYYFLEGVQF